MNKPFRPNVSADVQSRPQMSPQDITPQDRTGENRTGHHPTVDPPTLSPRCQSPNSRLEIPQQEWDRLVELEDAQVSDAIQSSVLTRRMEKRGSEIRRLGAALFGGGR